MKRSEGPNLRVALVVVVAQLAGCSTLRTTTYFEDTLLRVEPVERVKPSTSEHLAWDGEKLAVLVTRTDTCIKGGSRVIDRVIVTERTLENPALPWIFGTVLAGAGAAMFWGAPSLSDETGEKGLMSPRTAGYIFGGIAAVTGLGDLIWGAAKGVESIDDERHGGEVREVLPPEVSNAMNVQDRVSVSA